MAKIAMIVIGFLLLVLAAYIFRKQAKAKRCDVHNRKAGQIAIGLGAACVLSGIALICFGFLIG